MSCSSEILCGRTVTQKKTKSKAVNYFFVFNLNVAMLCLTQIN